MNYLNNVFAFLTSWISSQRQNVFYAVAVSGALIAIIFIIKNSKIKPNNFKNAPSAPQFNGYSENNFQSASQNVAFDSKFKVVEEILKTDSKNIIE